MRVLPLVVLATVLFTGSLIIANGNWDTFRSGETQFLDRGPLFAALQGFVLVMGVFFAAFHQRMRNLSTGEMQIFSPTSEIRKLLASAQFWMALSAAPVLFCVIVKLTEDMSETAALIVAFQNGFFWQKVLPQVEKNFPEQSVGV